jgi:hypothetical protein
MAPLHMVVLGWGWRGWRRSSVAAATSRRCPCSPVTRTGSPHNKPAGADRREDKTSFMHFMLWLLVLLCILPIYTHNQWAYYTLIGSICIYLSWQQNMTRGVKDGLESQIKKNQIGAKYLKKSGLDRSGRLLPMPNKTDLGRFLKPDQFSFFKQTHKVLL